MRQVSWTGHPFVDAGLAAIAAITDVHRLEDLTIKHLEHAENELKRILLSDQALGIGVIGKAFAKSALSQLFPNSELVNPSHWKGDTPEAKAKNVREKFQKSLREDLQHAKTCLTQTGEAVCMICGRKVPESATTFVRKDKMPLLVGIVNFYPGFAFGVRVCGLCAFAVRFLPMSVMRTGVSKRLWFLHTQDLKIAAKISKRYGWNEFNRAIAANESLEFYSRWQTAGDAGTVLYLIYEFLDEMGDELREVYRNPLPTTAYLFSNDNKNPYVQPLTIPNELLIFGAKLQLKSPEAFRRFWRDLLQVEEGLDEDKRKARVVFVQKVASKLLQSKSIIGTCLDHGDEKVNQPPKLQGGWTGHALYLMEVLKMPESKLAIFERLGIEIAQREDAKKRIMELRMAERGDLYAIFLRYVRDGWLRHDEFYTLLPPNEHIAASEIRDVLLAVIYDWRNCQEQGKEFTKVTKQVVLTADETLQRIQQIGERLCDQLPNLFRWIGKLQTSQTEYQIRGTYLSAVQRGAMSFSDFIFLAPLNDRKSLWLLRDYLLAFLFERVREISPKVEEEIEEEIAVGEEKLTAKEAFEEFEGGEV